MLLAAPEPGCGAVGDVADRDADEGVRATYSVVGVSSRELAKWDPMPVTFSVEDTIH
jgi:hypothetical protein